MALALVGSAFLANAAMAIAVPVESSFDADLDGWTCVPPSRCSWSASGGNPGGHLLFLEPTSQLNDALAPAKFLGDWSNLEEQGSLFLDLRVLSDTSFSNYQVRIEGPGGFASSTVPTPEGQPGWASVELPIRESAWLVDGSWNALLLDVQELRFFSNIINGAGEADGLDNVRLVPEPGTAFLVGIGLLAFAQSRRRSRRRD